MNADAQCAISLDQVLLDRVWCCALCSAPVLSKYAAEYLFVEDQALLDVDVLPDEAACVLEVPRDEVEGIVPEYGESPAP